MTRCLEIGPGHERIPGFETLNMRKTAITDHVGDARRPPFPDGCFDLVYSSHCLEHIPWDEVESTLREWVRILKPGGSLEVWTVDAEKLFRAILAFDETGEWAGPADLSAWQPRRTQGDPYKWAVGRLLNHPNKSLGEHNAHHALITPSYLVRCLRQCGLTNIRRMASHEVRGKDHGWINMGFCGLNVRTVHA